MMEHQQAADFYAGILAQLNPPAIARKDDRNNSNVFDSLVPGLLYKGDGIVQASLNGLVEAAIRASTTRCYVPTREPICFKFIIGQDSSLKGVIAYDSDGRPLMLNYAVLFRENKPAIIVYYKSSGIPQKAGEEWMLAENVAYISADNNTLAAEIKRVFKLFKNNWHKNKKKN